MHRSQIASVSLAALAFVACSNGAQPMNTALVAPVLGTAESFAVLGGSTVTSTGATTVQGNLGLFPGTEVIGFPPGLVTGTIHAGDANALQAQADVTTAYEALVGQACNFDLSGKDLGGLTLTQGVYCFSSSAQLTGALTLDAEGHPDAVFVFKIASTLTTASESSVRVINGGGPCNVFWQVGSSATLGTGTAFTGDILALTSITLTTGADLNGRALARNGAVTLDGNHISVGDCSVATDGGVVAATDLAITPAPADLTTTPVTDGTAPSLDSCTAAPDLTICK